MDAGLSPTERTRYSRHLLIPEVGEAGQMRLKQSSVLLVGAGALGSPAALYLAAAGVGRIAIADPDTVDLSNLHRQILHGEAWLGKSKLESAVARLREVNPQVRVEPLPRRFSPDLALDLARGHDLIVDGSDNFPTRFLTNDTAFLLRIPLVHGAVQRFEGQAAVFAPHLGGPCYRCLLPELPVPGSVPSCQEAGVFGVLPGVIGSLQAAEAIKLLLGIGTPPLGVLTIYDALRSSFRTLRVKRDPQCRLCGEARTIEGVANPETLASAACGMPDGEIPTIPPAALAARLAADPAPLLVDVREPVEHAAARIPDARLVPLGTLAAECETWPRDREIIVHCKSGMRSARAVELLHRRGFTRVVHLEGGIDAWRRDTPP